MKLCTVSACILVLSVYGVDSKTILSPNMPRNLLHHNLDAVYNSLTEILGNLIGETTKCLSEEQEFINSQLECVDKRGLELDEKHTEKRMPGRVQELKFLIVTIYFNAYRQQEFLRACNDRLAVLRGEPRVEGTTEAGTGAPTNSPATTDATQSPPVTTDTTTPPPATEAPTTTPPAPPTTDAPTTPPVTTDAPTTVVLP